MTRSPPSDTLLKLQAWYHAQCNGDWEHTYGITIDTLDNPGWCLTVELTDTYLYETEFDSVVFNGEHVDDWFQCKRKSSPALFDAACGPNHLSTVIGIFLDWAEANKVTGLEP
ncbi:immunity 53 family protein [Reyranella sp. CPCC 100927]|uniref:immunity 53 family protein n=1 Tax=Reyranella sp. CPCC 100927 TaxID=2599616 RepID=UPI0011B7CBC7|nr:immunity 53 family protein [Reyranella sp. CPCC 100927]TWT10180.1 hypothetical protein FQU96_19015 [Reyranella sp. CPCC 100927]